MGPPVCQQCSKFASMDEPEVEHEELDIDDIGYLTGQIEAVRRTACCGEDAKQGQYNPEGQVDHECPKEEDEEADHSFEMEDYEAEIEESVNTVDRKGNKIKSSRYMATLFIATMRGHVKCNACEEVVPFEISETLRASDYEELY